MNVHFSSKYLFYLPDLWGYLSRNALLEVIEELNPDIIISWGNKVWDAIPEDIGYGNYVAREDFSDFFYKYPYKNRELKLLGITHPSTSYKSSYWADVFSKVGVNI